MPNGKTIRQIADEIGVTRQAIYKKFKLNSAVSDSLKAHSFTVDKVKYYTAEERNCQPVNQAVDR